jgi:hypothetical protein
MSLLGFQKALLAVYTNDEARRFRTQGTGQPFQLTDLTERELSALRLIPERQLAIFISSILTKRETELEKSLSRKKGLMLSPWRLVGPAAYFIDKKRKKIKYYDLSAGQYSVFQGMRAFRITPARLMRSLSEHSSINFFGALSLFLFLQKERLWTERVGIYPDDL